ncbi:ParA family protein [Clostridium uliginosum]|uniref:Sporulation initiation inhibitor protein Soj n=1 Tax=Clostridium uliginosum TaxID=119641 RepID=A0A1I1IU82_9CLOT|nr:AAA family ATPase [Clostridium uliginosum]SFC37868.1 chromosome partitioning protein [Clostridium uliginosum]
MGVVISILNNKGGVGKSTSTYNLGYELSKLGKKTLIIDLDPQSSLSVYVGLDPLEHYASIENVFRGDMDLEDVIVQTGNENLYMVPSCIEFSTIEMYLMGVMGRETVLDKALEKAKEDFDYILIDNSPSLGNTTINSLFASDYAIAPTDASYLSFRALGILNETVKQVQEYNKNLKEVKVLITMYDSRANHCKEVAQLLQEKYYVFPDLIKTSIKFKDAVMRFESITQYAGEKFDGAIAYKNVAKEIMSW